MASVDINAIVQFEEAAYSPTGSATTVANEVLGAVTGVGILRPEFLTDGVRARVLNPGGQWQEGVVRLSLEFTPGTPTIVPPTPAR